jgi:hypothetical protein
MPFKLPDKFVQTTRWAYVDNGIENGPYDADEIVELLEKRKIGPETVIILLGKRRTCPVLEVKPFADYIKYVIEKQKWEKTEKDFEKTKSQFEKGDGMRNTILAGLAIAVVVGGLIALAIVNPFAAPATKTAVKPEKEAAPAKADVVTQKEEPKEEEFKILEADDPLFQENEEKKIVETVKKEHLLAASAEFLDADMKKLQAPKNVVPAEAKKPRRKKPNNGGPAAVEEPPVEEMTITTLDFSEDEEDDSELQSSSELAEQRLGEALKKCSLQAMFKHQDVERWSIMARAVLEPSGRMKGLRLNISPQKHVGEIKMCTSAEMMRLRVPGYDGPSTTIVVNATVTAN